MASAEEAHRLYWESDISVSEIAERLGLSRRALYEAVQPVPAGPSCPRCGAGLVFLHRSARSAGEGACPECGAEHDVAALREDAATAGADESYTVGPGAPVDVAASARRSRLVLWTSAAIAGLAAGVAVLLLKRRR